MNVVVLAGGCGTRLWPASRASYPKQFLNLATPEETMLQATLSRVSALSVKTVTVVCNEEHRFIVAQQAQDIGVKVDRIILEPEAKNTAPAIALAALSTIEFDSTDEPLLVLAADHLIENQAEFLRCVSQAARIAVTNRMVTFGVEPSSPHTGYGYIKSGAKYMEGYSIASFVEKPNAETAERYLASKDYYWNSGMFVLLPEQYLAELRECAPAVLSCCLAAYEQAAVDSDFVRVDAATFSRCPNVSIDYAVMEKSHNAVVLPFAAGWNDIGSWSSLADETSVDEDGNVSIGDVISLDSKDNYLRAEDRFVATIGVKNLVIVETRDAVLVADRNNVDQVKTLVENLLAESKPVAGQHLRMHRPWGRSDLVDRGKGYQVKRLTVAPSAKLSTQKHHHRAEHWIVVSGVARVVKGDDEFTLVENQSTYIPLGVIHSLENPGNEPLEIIEVQSGDYLGEDDIVRLDDRYGRN